MKKKSNSKIKERGRQIMRWAARGIVGAALAVAALFAVRLVLSGSLSNLEAFRLEEIHYTGLTHSNQDELDKLIRLHVPGNALTIDLDRVRALVEGEDWVRGAVVRRKLPNEIFVVVTERQPVAVASIDGELRVVDEDGVILAPFGPDFQALDRPIVKGLKNVALENALHENAARMKVYLQILRDLDAADRSWAKSISEIDVADPGRVAVAPTHYPVPVYLGDSDFASRYRTFLSRLDLVRELRDRHGAIESIDVTYDGKIIIHTPQSTVGRKAAAKETS